MSSITKNLVNSIEEEEEETCRMAMHVSSSSILPMTLRAAIELNLLELIQKSEPASASELASLLPTNNPEAANMIDRILRLLAAHSILTCTRGSSERRYGLTQMSRFLTRNEEGVSLVPCFSLLIQDRTFMEMCYHVKDAVLDGGISFNRAHGMSPFELAAINPRFNELFNRAMSETSVIVTKKILEKYDGFEGLQSLADVGGGIGTSLKMILSVYPSIKGINFDLPHVLEHAPSHPGVEHVSGDMFLSVPKADAIFVKWILHDWSDEPCKKLLKNCYETLPENGKVIVADFMFPEDTNVRSAHMQTVQLDMFMMCFNSGIAPKTNDSTRR